MAHITVAEERYQFTPELKKKVYYLLGAGIVLFIVGLVLAMSGGGHDDAGGHAAVSASQEMVASLQDHASAPHAEAGEHHGSSLWLKRMWASLWTNNMYFVGIAIIGLFFVAIQYAAQAGWSAGILRIPLAMAQWLPIAGILTLVLWFLASGDLFHW